MSKPLRTIDVELLLPEVADGSTSLGSNGKPASLGEVGEAPSATLSRENGSSGRETDARVCRREGCDNTIAPTKTKKTKYCDDDACFKARRKVICRRYTQANPEVGRAQSRRWRTKNRTAYNLNQREYRANNPDKVRLWNTNELTGDTDIPGSYSDDDLKALWEDQEGCCAFCSKQLRWNQTGPLTADTWSVEHIIPRSRDGCTHWPENLAIACLSCNSSKSNRLLWSEWIPPHPIPMFARAEAA